MSRTFRVSLGFSSLTGKQAFDQAKRFKDQLRSLSPKPDAASLLTVTHPDPPHVEVVAFYNADDPCAVEWVKQADAVSAELWLKLAERRKGVAR